MSDIRIGLLGVGRIGQMHADLINRTDGLAVSMVYDVFAEAAQAAAHAVGAELASSAEELITSDTVDAVAICTSTDTHIDLLVAAAEAGKPVFIEKPLSLDLSEVDRGVKAVKDAGISVLVGFNRRFDPSHRAVRDHVRDGSIGDLHILRITSRDPAPPPIDYVKVSGGLFSDMMIHDFDMANYVAGSPVETVYATGGVRVDPAIGEAGDIDTAVVTMVHADGAITTIDNSRQAVYGYDQRVEAFGSGGVVASDNHLDHTATLRTPQGSQGAKVPYFFLDRYIPSYVAEWESFRDMVANGAPSPVTIDDGRVPLVLAMAAKQSLASGVPVAVADIDGGQS